MDGNVSNEDELRSKHRPLATHNVGGLKKTNSKHQLHPLPRAVNEAGFNPVNSFIYLHNL